MAIQQSQRASTEAPKLLEREPVRTYGTVPATVLAMAGAITAFGVGSPLVALGCAAGLTVIGALLELIRARVTPAPVSQVAVPAPVTSVSTER